MKLSDKALRQIARKLLDRQDISTRQAPMDIPARPTRNLRGQPLRAPGRQDRAAVLHFKKRLR